MPDNCFHPRNRGRVCHSCSMYFQTGRKSCYIFSFCSYSKFYMEYGVIEYLKGLYSVYDRMYSLCAVCKPQRFLFCLSPCLFSDAQFCDHQRFPFIAIYVFLVVVTVCKPQRFISVYCQFVFLSGVCATTDVGRTFCREFTLVREVRTTAVSRRLRKTDWCFYSVFV